MHNRTRLLTLIALGLGLALGYAAASGKLNPFDHANAAHSEIAPLVRGNDTCAKPAAKNELLALAAHNHLVEAQTAESGKKPNIVLVFMDNLGWGEPGCYGGGILRGAPTPRIDKLASEGMRLLNFNVEAQCTPSRAAIMTGRYAIRTGNPTIPIETPVYGLTQWEYTMPKMLGDAGYASAMYGKWHLGQTKGRFPTDQGFDEWYGIPNSSDESTWPDNPRYRPDSHPFAKPEQTREGLRLGAPFDRGDLLDHQREREGG